MELELQGQPVYAYTGGKPFDTGRPCVVFIHGAQNDHSVWALQSRWFAHHGYSVLAIDLPGHGRSGGAALPSIESLADWIELLLEKVGAGMTASDETTANFTLVGHSMGSLTALACAARHPARITRIALVGTAVPMPVSESLLNAARDNEAKAISMINSWSHSPRASIGGNTQPGMWMLGTARRLMQRQPRGVLFNDLSACNAYAQGLDDAATVRCPVLLLSGSRDLMASPKALGALMASLPDCRSVTLNGAGHSLMAEQPDAVLDALRKFIP
jgi:pimeloyl-ACP methyl ester carboxylesterase